MTEVTLWLSGVVDEEAGPAHLDVQHSHVHRWRPVQRDTPGAQWWLGPAHRVRAETRRGRIRVPGQHRTQNQHGRYAECRRYQHCVAVLNQWRFNCTLWLYVDAQASIWGSQDVYVKKGSTISLTCSVNVHSTPPSSVLWYHGASVVDFDSQRGGISLETEKTESGTTSKLLITKASLTDSGNYTCVPSNATPASVSVHVLNGEFTQHFYCNYY